MEAAYQKILDEQLDTKWPEPIIQPTVRRPQTRLEAKKKWYKIGEVLLRGHKLDLCKESKVGARRAYRYYSVHYGKWDGPSARQFSKVNQKKFEELLEKRSKEPPAVSDELFSLSDIQQYIAEHLVDWDPTSDEFIGVN